MTQTMSERVARALCEDPDPDKIIYTGAFTVETLRGEQCRVEVGKPAWRFYEKRSRRIIEAMREPTKDMGEAGSKAVMEYHEAYVSEGDAETAWCAMIDAALKEPDASP